MMKDATCFAGSLAMTPFQTMIMCCANHDGLTVVYVMVLGITDRDVNIITLSNQPIIKPCSITTIETIVGDSENVEHAQQ